MEKRHVIFLLLTAFSFKKSVKLKSHLAVKNKIAIIYEYFHSFQIIQTDWIFLALMGRYFL